MTCTRFLYKIVGMASDLVQLTFWAPPAARERWREAAREANLSLSAWVRQVLDRASAADEPTPEPEPVPVVEHVKLSDMPPVPKPKGKPPLCTNCARKGAPACADCCKAAGLKF